MRPVKHWSESNHRHGKPYRSERARTLLYLCRCICYVEVGGGARTVGKKILLDLADQWFQPKWGHAATGTSTWPITKRNPEFWGEDYSSVGRPSNWKARRDSNEGSIPRDSQGSFLPESTLSVDSIFYGVLTIDLYIQVHSSYSHRTVLGQWRNFNTE